MPLHNFVLLLACAADTEPAPVLWAPREEVRRLIAFIVKTAEANRASTRRVVGDALTDHYVRQASEFASKENLSPRAYLVALGIALDRSDQLRLSRELGWYLKLIESDTERMHRLEVLGRPSLLGREDWLAHFAVCAALTAQLGPLAAEQIGIMKELRDSRGSSGFSFADLAADHAGICFARGLLDPARDVRQTLSAVAKQFRGKSYLPEMADLEDGLPRKDLLRKYGEPGDPRFQRACQEVRQRVAALPVFRKLESGKPRSRNKVGD